LIVTEITEPLVVYFKVAFLCGAVLASPWVLYQLWTFVAAGLYPHERRWVWTYLPASLALFLGGAAFCQFVVLPAGVACLLGYGDWLGVDPELRLGGWLNFALLLPLAFGLSFQTPLAMLFLHRAGAVDAGAFGRHRRAALLGLAVLAAVVTPPDAVNMLALAVPLWGLYELGIFLCRLAPRPDPA
jgi:sec-independent protein translocase protein TatC